LALVISALKHQKIPFTPFSLKRAIENTARQIENVEKLAQGYGLIQVNESFEYSKKTAEISHLRLDVKFPQRNNARGLYVRDAWEFNSLIEKNMEVLPIFSKSISNTDKVQFEIKLNVKCTIPGVKVAEHLVLMAESRTMKVSADPSLFPEGKLVHGEILFTDSAKPEHGALLRVPLTFIKPATLKEHTLQSSAPIKFTPGHIERRFINVPEHATWAEVTVQANKFENNKLMLIVAYPYLKQWSSRNVDETYFWIQGDEKYVWPIRVHGGQPLELDIGQSWSSIGSSGDVNFKVEFHGVNVPPQLHLGPGDKLVRCDVATHLREEEIAPTAKLGVIRKTLRPTSSQIKTACPDRDVDMDGQQIYEMTLSYTYEHVNETSYKVITRVVGLSEYLYESPHEAQFWMVFDQNKKLIAKGDAWPKAFAVPAKGTYTVRVLMRSVSSKTLESMKDWPLFVDIQVPKDKQVAVDIFTTFDGALTGGAKVKTVKMAKGRVNTLWFKAPEDSAVSSLSAEKGDLLLGRVSWKKLEGEEPAMYGGQGINLHEGETAISFTYSVNGKSNSSSSSAQKFVPDAKKSALENHIDFLASESLQYALKLSADKDFDGAKAVLGSLKIDKETQPGLHLNYLHALVKVAVAEKSAKDEVSLNEAVISAADNLIAAVDTTKLAAYKNAKDPAIAGFDAKLWALTDTVYTDALYLKANALLETLLAKEKQNELTNEDKETYNKLYDALKKQFPTLESDGKYAKFVVFSEKFSGRLFSAMAVLLKKWNSPLNKEALSTIITLLEQSGMTDAAQYYRKLCLVSFPEKYPLLA
jgi:tripeptidyl-peptidase-2